MYGDESAVDVLDRFERLVLEAMGETPAPMKWIGDEVMLAFATPEAALRALGLLLPACRLDPNIPLTRTAIHHGAVIRKRGDLFGATVNIAARIAARAEPGQMLATAPVAQAARLLGIEVLEHGEVQLRSVASPTALFAIELAPASDPAWICPVCKMHARYEAYQRTRPEGPWFCSDRCAGAYAKAPHVYATSAAARREGE